MGASRRQFLAVGASAAVLLAGGGAWYRLSRPESALERFVLDGEARSALEAIIPVMLAGALPDQAGASAVHAERVASAIAGLPLATQKEIQDLFGLLALAPFRRLVAGVSGPWSGADPAQVSAFLDSWRFHRLGMLQSAYHALHDLILGPWYADPSNWAAIGYPGPLKELA